MKSAEVMWGIVILVVAGGITLITYVAATPGGTYFLAYGAIIWGAYKVLRGLGSASVFWRIVGLATMAAMVVVGVLVFQDSRNLSDLYNSTHVGECVDLDGLATECDRFDAKEVMSVHLYPNDMAFPGQSKFDADSEGCPLEAVLFFSPTRETWDGGDRSLLCVR